MKFMCSVSNLISLPAGRHVKVSNKLFAVAALGAGTCAEVAAQFGATGGPSQAAELLVTVPWVFILASFLLAGLGPTALRSRFRRALKHAFVAYICIQATLLLLIVIFRILQGPMTEPLTTIGIFFLVGIFYSGVLISAIMVTSLVVAYACGMLRKMSTLKSQQ